ncbi:MAG: response regulator transcription factor [Dethiobacter sp.]|nr:response regulator transcription factor [Dethiobacter sp.]MBS3982512.1 response regulator transcription factor [Dethiobacter sp.]MCL4463245.1 response regulator transcription factor [Bacillota bacterium]MCL5992994.1 response regulator transcription factor [Bacillota bacterium]
MSKKVLVVDDESKIRRILQQILLKEGFAVVEAENGREALACFLAEKPDLVILDIMMPEMDGFDFLRTIRKKYDTPVIILSAKDELLDKTIGFTLEADDYVAKPFSPLELALRAKAVLKRSQASKQQGESIRIADVELNFTTHRLFVRDQRVDLTPKEFKLLAILIRHAGQILTREQLLKLSEDDPYIGDSNAVNVFINRLRQKIEKDPAKPEYLLTVRGIGYKFAPANKL